MKFSIRSMLSVFLLVFIASACMGEPVEIIDSNLQNPKISDNDQGLIGNVPLNSPIDPGTPVPVAPITISSPEPESVAIVEATALNVREGPDTSFPIITSAKQGERLAVIGQFRVCDWLRVNTRAGETGWVKSGPGYANFEGNCQSIASGPFRPLNGTLVYDRRSDYGPGTLSVENFTTNDGLVVITNMNSDPLVGFYIRSMEEFTVTGFNDGEFLCYFTYGQAWDGNSNKFMVVSAIKKMDQTLDFYSDASGYTTWTLSLSSLGGEGSASASDIPANTFPGLN
jgi:hypothetical protein